jgi:hypothetical protein
VNPKGEFSMLMRAATVHALFGCLLVLTGCGSTSSGSDGAGATSSAGGSGGAAGSGESGTSSGGSSDAGSGGTATAGGAGGSTGGASTGGASATGGAAGSSDSGGAAGAAVGCDVSPAPTSLPMLTTTFVQVDSSMNITVPTMTGGDPTGAWSFDKLTLFIPESAKGQVDPTMSSGAGTGWANVGSDGSYRLEIDLNIDLSTALGDIKRTTMSASKGTYTVSGAALDFVVTCDTNSATTMTTITFSRTAGASTGQFLVHIVSDMGATDLLLQGSVM